MKSSAPVIYLASSSPRRKELLTSLGLQFKILSPDIFEQQKAGESPTQYALRNAKEKAQKVVEQVGPDHENYVVVAADTIVVHQGKVFEKPNDPAHAFRMLKVLNGQVHTVVTGVRIVGRMSRRKIDESFLEKTKVKLLHLKPQSLRDYIATGEPFGKAGAYAAQGIGAFMVDKIQGNYANVVGLPIHRVYQILHQNFRIQLSSSNE